MGPRPSATVKTLPKFSSPWIKAAFRPPGSSSMGEEKVSPASGALVMTWSQPAMPMSATADRKTATHFMEHLSIRILA